MTRTLTREARLQTLSFTLGTAANMIRELGTDDAFLRMTAADPLRWGPLLDQLSASVESGAPGTVTAILGAISVAMDA
jgi:hypothetical protein